MSVWTRAMVAAKIAVAAPTMATISEREGRAVEEEVGPGDHVDAGGDHGGGVDERRDGRGAFHGVGEPDVERKLRALAGGADEQAEGDGGEDASGPGGLYGQLGGDHIKGEGTEVSEQQKHADEEAEVADAVDDEGFHAGVGCGRFLEPEADEEIGGETDAFPADEHQKGVAGQHQNGHEEEEEVQVAEVARVAFFMGHVAGGVDVDEEADAGDDQEHDERELIEDKAVIDVEGAGVDPAVAKSFDVRAMSNRLRMRHSRQRRTMRAARAARPS